MDRRLIYLGVIVVAMIVLSFFGLTPQVLLAKVQELGVNAKSAAQKTRHLSDKRERRVNEATDVLDGLPKKEEH